MYSLQGMRNGALHEEMERDGPPAGSSDRAFGLVFAVVFALIGLWPLLHAEPPRLWPFAPAALALGFALLAPRLLAPLNRLWTRFGHLLAKVSNPLVLGLLFFVLVTPMGLAMRVFGKDPLRRRLEPDAPSYWIPRPPPAPGPMSRQF